MTHRKGDTDDAANVMIKIGTGDPAAGPSLAPSVGRGWFARNFLRSPGRFPPSGGHVLEPGKKYEVFLLREEKDAAGKVVAKFESEHWGPYDVVAGAIIDLELTPHKLP